MAISTVLLQNGGDHSIRNTDGKTALDLADTYARSVLTGIVTEAGNCVII